MNSKDVATNAFTSMSAAARDAESGPDKPAVRVKELSERDRRRLLRHFLELGESDRLLRFGTPLPDESITTYVQKMDFRRDTVFGVYDRKLKLVGVGHLAFAAREALPVPASATLKARAAEFGLSVSEAARGQGIGFKLFERAAIHCRNADVDTLYMHCLSSNQTMIHIAKKSGMEIHRAYGEADAYLRLSPANSGSVLKEAVDEQVAVLDYAFKANARAAAKFLENLPRRKDK